MVELFDGDKRELYRQSSKGNQLKWEKDGIWYKADYTGYEGLTEYLVSGLLKLSSLKSSEFVSYKTEQILCGSKVYNGCRSQNFLPEGWSLITLERLFRSTYGESLSKNIYQISDKQSRLEFLVDQVVRMTGLTEFGVYMCKLLAIDAMFLNEDRHMHNVAVLMDVQGDFHYCPLFDHGAALLSDITMDYPLDQSTELLMEKAEPKTFCRSFEEQLDIAEKLYGQQLRFDFTIRDAEVLLEQEAFYSEEIKERVKEILRQQIRKYRYLF